MLLAVVGRGRVAERLAANKCVSLIPTTWCGCAEKEARVSQGHRVGTPLSTAAHSSHRPRYRSGSNRRRRPPTLVRPRCAAAANPIQVRQKVHHLTLPSPSPFRSKWLGSSTPQSPLGGCAKLRWPSRCPDTIGAIRRSDVRRGVVGDGIAVSRIDVGRGRAKGSPYAPGRPRGMGVRAAGSRATAPATMRWRSFPCCSDP